jgi:hypothetical protein
MSNLDDSLTSSLDQFARILTNDPGALAPSDKFYVPNLHGTGSEDVVTTLQRACERVEGSALFYFTGQRGTGKSTELKRLATQLSGLESKAFIVDALDYISDNHPIELIDLLLVVAIAFSDLLRADTGEELLKEGIGKRFSDWLGTEVAIPEVGVNGAKVVFRQQQQSIIKRIHEYDLARKERFVAECSDFISGLAAFARQHYKRDRIVLIVDSLERLRGVGAAATQMYDTVVKVFDEGIDTLRRIGQIQLIFSVPPYLPYLSNVKNMVRVFTLASVRVFEPPSKSRRSVRESGVETMRRVVKTRFPDWTKVLRVGALDKLIAMSGGDIRQFLRRLLIDVVDEAYFALDRLPLSVDDPIIEIVIERHRVEFEQMVVQSEYPLLRLIADENTLELRDRSDFSTAARFFDLRAVLNYRNGTEWIDLNPLLWQLIDQSPPKTLSPNGGT